MSHSPVSTEPHVEDTLTTTRTQTVDPDGDGQEILEALTDGVSRSILSATTGEALSASEIADTHDLPLSTAYRKLEQLTDAGLLAESIRIRTTGPHVAEYARAVETVSVSLDANGGVELQVHPRDRADNPLGAAIPAPGP